MTWFIVLLVLSVVVLATWKAKQKPPNQHVNAEKTLEEILGKVPRQLVAPIVTLEVQTPPERSDQVWFDRVFESLLAQLDGDIRGLREMAPLLISEAMSGNHYRGREWMQKDLPEGSWRWPEFERQWGDRQRTQHAQRVAEIHGMQDGELLETLRLQDLRKLAAGRVKGRSKAELIEALQTVLDQNEFIVLVGQGRHVLLDALPDPCRFDYSEQCDVFLRRLTSLAYGRRNLEELRASPIHDQMKAVFRPGGAMNTPKECILRNGKTYALNDPELDTLTPCGRLDCGCSISTAIDGWRRT